MRAYLWVRATLDWESPAVHERITPGFEPKVRLWDETFNLPYTAFRAELRRIAQLNLSRVRGASVTEDWDAIPDGALVLPVDDDDWFAPGVVEAIGRVADPDAVAYRWQSTFLERPISLGHALSIQRRRMLPGLRPHFFCTTNNYALPKASGARKLAERHELASEAFVDAPGVVHVPGSLSVMNRTLASQTSLGWVSRRLTRRDLLRRYRSYRSLYAAPPERLPEWSHEYVDLVARLMRRLERR